MFISEVGKSEQSESNREIGFGSVAVAMRLRNANCDAVRCEMRNAMRSCVSGCEGECSPSDFPGAGIFPEQCPPPCRAAARGSPFGAAVRGPAFT